MSLSLWKNEHFWFKTKIWISFEQILKNYAFIEGKKRLKHTHKRFFAQRFIHHHKFYFKENISYYSIIVLIIYSLSVHRRAPKNLVTSQKQTKLKEWFSYLGTRGLAPPPQVLWPTFYGSSSRLTRFNAHDIIRSCLWLLVWSLFRETLHFFITLRSCRGVWRSKKLVLNTEHHVIFSELPIRSDFLFLMFSIGCFK